MSSSIVRKLSIVAFIVIVGCGKHDGLSDAKYRVGQGQEIGSARYRICYVTHLTNFCADLHPSENVTLQDVRTSSGRNFNPNLVLNVPNVTKLDLSMNAISNLRFYDSGTAQLQAGLSCVFLRGCSKETDKKCQNPDQKCKYFQYESSEELIGKKQVNVTKSVRTLILSHNSLQNLSYIFTPFENLEHLDLSHNLIKDVSDEAFANNSKLVTLKLNNNLIESLRKETFEHLRNLQTLDISSNRFAGLNLDIFEYLSDLLVLRINDNFHSANGPQQSSSFIFSAGQKFERLEMTGTSLGKIPIVLTRSIRELVLSNNSLVLIQRGEMDSYPLLQILSLRNNKLETVEEDSLGRLEYLIELDFYGNSLCEIPLSLPISLLRLDLGLNQIKGINKTDFSGLIHLKTLILSNNKIKFLEEGVFSPVVNLEYLDLSNNPVKILTSSIFAGPKNMINLQLSNLSEIGCEAAHSCDKTFPFTELERLEILNLSSSPLLSQQMILDQSVMPALGHLRELNLVDTNLTQLNPEIVNYLRRLQKLEVYRNPFDCSKSVVWLKEWLTNLKTNSSSEICLENRNKSTDNSSIPSFATIRVMLPQNKSGSNEQLAKETGSSQMTPRCSLPATFRGKSLFDISVNSAEDDKLKSPKINDSLKPVVENPKSGVYDQEKSDSNKKINKTKQSNRNPTLEKKTEVNDPMTLLQIDPVVKKSSLDDFESEDKGKSVSNSVMSNVEKGNDEIFYQNDEPGTNSPAPREKTEFHSKTLRNFDIMHEKEVQYVTDKTEDGKRNESSEAASNSYVISSTQVQNSTEKIKVTKQEVKSINKTHIEISRLGLRNKNTDTPKVGPEPGKMGPKVEEKEDKEVAESSKQTLKTETSTSQTISGSIEHVPQGTELKSRGLQTQNPTSDVTDFDGRPTMSTPGGTTVENNRPQSVLSASTVPVDKKRPRAKHQEVTVSLLSSQIPPDFTTPKYPLTTQNMKKNKSLDEKSESSSRHGRKKLAKQMKDTTTSHTEMLQSFTPPLDLTTNPTPKRQMKLEPSARSIVKKNKTMDEKSDESQTTTAKRTEHKPAAIVKSESERGLNNSRNTTTGARDKIALRSKNDKVHENIKLSDLAPRKIEDKGELQVKDKIDTSSEILENEKTNKTNKNSKPPEVPRKSNKMNIGKKQIGDNDNSDNATIMNHEESKLDTTSGGKIKTIGQKETDKDKIKKSDGNKNAEADITRNKINRDSILRSDTTLTAKKEELKVNYDSHDKMKSLVATSSETTVANANKYNGNLESGDGMDKGGSHPGMLIFLLVVSVLLFTLSLMLISHWTWCKRLNMYELGDRQILEESDYEINSLTNFKDHERW